MGFYEFLFVGSSKTVPAYIIMSSKDCPCTWRVLTLTLSEKANSNFMITDIFTKCSPESKCYGQAVLTARASKGIFRFQVLDKQKNSQVFLGGIGNKKCLPVKQNSPTQPSRQTLWPLAPRNSSDPSDHLWVCSKRNRTGHGSCRYRRRDRKRPVLGSPPYEFCSSTSR